MVCASRTRGRTRGRTRCRCGMAGGGVRTRWTLAALLVLVTVCGTLAPPAASRTNGTALERRWETLLSRSFLGVSGGRSQLDWGGSDYLQGIKRVRRLYCNVGIGFHLEVLPDGSISGSHSETQYSLMEISTVDRGVISLFGLNAQLFVAMNSRGRLYGTRVFREECQFKEALLPNNYNAYESFVYQGFYIALSKHGRVKRGNRATTAMTATHFLPRLPRSTGVIL